MQIVLIVAVVLSVTLFAALLISAVELTGAVLIVRLQSIARQLVRTGAPDSYRRVNDK